MKRKINKPAKTDVLPIRIGPKLLEHLDEVAQKLGTNRSSLVVYLTRCFVEQFEALGEVVLPLNWKKQIESMDGRTKISRETKKDLEAILAVVRESEQRQFSKPLISAASTSERSASPSDEAHLGNNQKRDLK